MTPIQEAAFFELVDKLRTSLSRCRSTATVNSRPRLALRLTSSRSEVDIHPKRPCRGVNGHDTTATARERIRHPTTPRRVHRHTTPERLVVCFRGRRTDSMREAVRLKETGYKRLRRLHLRTPGGHHGLAIELKREKGGRSASQKEWKERLEARGYRTTVAKGTTRPKKSSKSTSGTRKHWAFEDKRQKWVFFVEMFEKDKEGSYVCHVNTEEQHKTHTAMTYSILNIAASIENMNATGSVSPSSAPRPQAKKSGQPVYDVVLSAVVPNRLGQRTRLPATRNSGEDRRRSQGLPPRLRRVKPPKRKKKGDKNVSFFCRFVWK